VPNVGKKDTVAVLMVGKSTTSTLSKDTVIGVTGGRRAAYPRLPPKRKSYVCALRGK
jgi:hypothetical protein